MRTPTRQRVTFLKGTTMNDYPDLETLKAQAKRLRQTLAKSGTEVSHSRALELLAQSMGLQDWNTLHAKIGNAAIGWQLGQKIRGRYLGHAITGRIHAVTSLPGGFFRLVLDFDQPVDVVASEHFSSWRRRVSATIGADGETFAKTSDGQPHLRLLR
ncbi:MAG: hypothetical protein ACJASV_002737 [Pseudorhodobacter sp.]|jgi:hypothetical protein